MKRSIPELEPNSSIKINWKLKTAQQVIFLFISENLPYTKIDELLFSNINNYENIKSERILKSLGLTAQFKGLFRNKSLDSIITSLRATNKIQYLQLINTLRYKDCHTEIEVQTELCETEDPRQDELYKMESPLKIAYSITELGVTENELFDKFKRFGGEKIRVLIDELNKEKTFDYFSIHKLMMEKYPNVFTDKSTHATIKVENLDLQNESVINKISASIGKGKTLKSINELGKTEEQIFKMFSESRGMSVTKFIDKLNINHEFSEESIHKMLIEKYGNMFTSDSTYAIVKLRGEEFNSRKNKFKTFEDLKSIDELGITEAELFKLFEQFKGKKLRTLIDELNRYKKFTYSSTKKILMDRYHYVFSSNSDYAVIKSKFPNKKNESKEKKDNIHDGKLVNSIADFGMDEKNMINMINQFKGMKISRIIDELNRENKFSKSSIHRLLIKNYGKFFTDESISASVKLNKLELKQKLENVQSARILESFSELGLSEDQLLELIDKNRGKKLSNLVNELDKDRKFHSISVYKLFLTEYPQFFTNDTYAASVKPIDSNKDAINFAIVYSLADLGISESQLLILFEKYKGLKLSSLIDDLNQDNKFDKASVRKLLIDKYRNFITEDSEQASIKKGINEFNEKEKIVEIPSETEILNKINNSIKLSPNSTEFYSRGKLKQVSSISQLGKNEKQLFKLFNLYRGRPLLDLMSEINKENEFDEISLGSFLTNEYYYVFTDDKSKVRLGRIKPQKTKKFTSSSTKKSENVEHIEKRMDSILSQNNRLTMFSLISELTKNFDVEETEILKILEKKYPNKFSRGYYENKIEINRNIDSSKELLAEYNMNDTASDFDRIVRKTQNMQISQETVKESRMTSNRKLSLEIKETTGYSTSQLIELMKAFDGKELNELIKEINFAKRITDNRLKLLVVRLFPDQVFNGYIVMDSTKRMEKTSLKLVNFQKKQLDSLEGEKEKVDSLKGEKLRGAPDENTSINRGSKTISSDFQGKVLRKELIKEYVQEVLNKKILLSYKETVHKLEKKHGYSVFLSTTILLELGYKRFRQYILHVDYRSPEQAIREYIKSNKVTNVAETPFRNLEIFREVLAKLEKNREIYEITPKHYISDISLQSVGIDRRMINDFVKKIEMYINKENKFFTIYCLINSNFTHPLLDIGFENYFYEKLIKMNTRVLQWIGGKEIIFYKTVPKRKLLLADFFMWHIEKEGIMDYQDLINILLNNYGVEYNHHTVKQNIEKRGGYYSTETEKFYINKKLYYKEVYY